MSYEDHPDPIPPLPIPSLSCPPDNQSYNAQQEETGAMVMWASGHYPVTGYTARQPSPSIHLLPHFKSLSLSTPADQALLICPSSLSLFLSLSLLLSQQWHPPPSVSRVWRWKPAVDPCVQSFLIISSLLCYQHQPLQHITHQCREQNNEQEEKVMVCVGVKTPLRPFFSCALPHLECLCLRQSVPAVSL